VSSINYNCLLLTPPFQFELIPVSKYCSCIVLFKSNNPLKTRTTKNRR